MTHSVLGVSLDTREHVHISQASRRQGLYLIGSNGTGKSGLLTNLLLQDIAQEKGLCVLDPHGGLIEAVLQRCDKRVDEVLLLDIAAKEHPCGINPFASADGDRVVSEVMDVFEKVYEVSRTTPRMAEVLRNSFRTITENPGLTLAEIPLLLADPSFRKRHIAHLTDPQTVSFWRRYESRNKREQDEYTESTLNKLDELLQPLVRNIIGQSKPTINFRQIMDQRKILLVKLDARMRDVTSLIGSLIIAGITNAAFSREAIPEKKRVQFNVYADEFQRFATETFATLFSEGRKYGIATTVAHQFREQLDEQNRAATRQVANMVMLRISGEDAKELVTELDIEPPPPPIAGERAIRTIKQDAVDQLLKGHTSRVVNDFVQMYLSPANDFKVQKTKVRIIDAGEERFLSVLLGLSDTHFLKSGEIEEAFGELNRLLYEAMSTRTADAPLPLPLLITCGKFCGYKHIMVPYFYGLPWHAYVSSNGYEAYESIEMTRSSREETWPDLVPLAGSDFESHLPALCQRLVIDPRINYGHAVHEQEFIQLVTFLRHLRSVMEELARNPVYESTGQYTQVYQSPRPYADMLNEVMLELANLPNFHAYAKVAEDGMVRTVKIKTLPPPPPVRGYEKIRDTIITRCLKEGYLRERSAVEEEIRRRQLPPPPPSSSTLL